jgi:hypothetical protein
MTSKNYLIAYDLNKPGQQYDRMQEGIKKVATWYMKLQYSLYYIRSDKSGAEIYQILCGYQDANDKLAVIEASNAWVSHLTPEQLSTFQSLWTTGRPAKAA